MEREMIISKKQRRDSQTRTKIMKTQKAKATEENEELTYILEGENKKNGRGIRETPDADVAEMYFKNS